MDFFLVRSHYGRFIYGNAFDQHNGFFPIYLSSNYYSNSTYFVSKNRSIGINDVLYRLNMAYNRKCIGIYEYPYHMAVQGPQEEEEQQMVGGIVFKVSMRCAFAFRSLNLLNCQMMVKVKFRISFARIYVQKYIGWC